MHDDLAKQSPSSYGEKLIDRGRSCLAHHSETSLSTGFSWIQGLPLLFSAPHAVTHFRDGNEKQQEPATDAMAAGIAEAIGGSAIWATPGLNGDPNWDYDHPYKSRAMELAKDGIALDLHVMMNRGFDICLGLGEVKPIDRGLWSICAEEFLNEGYTVSLNYPFSAGPRTVTSHLQTHGVRAIQVEMTWDVCSDEGRGALTTEILLRISRSLM